MLLSKSTGGFYIDGFHTDIPDDSVEITSEQYNEFLDGLSAGKVISWGNGAPTLANPIYVPPSMAELLAAANMQRDSFLSTAAIRIAPLQDAVDLGGATDADAANLKLWKQYRVDVNRIDQQVGFPANINWPTPPA